MIYLLIPTAVKTTVVVVCSTNSDVVHLGCYIYSQEKESTLQFSFIDENIKYNNKGNHVDLTSLNVTVD